MEPPDFSGTPLLGWERRPFVPVCINVQNILQRDKWRETFLGYSTMLPMKIIGLSGDMLAGQGVS
jgi:hypothetical protein